MTISKILKLKKTFVLKKMKSKQFFGSIVDIGEGKNR